MNWSGLTWVLVNRTEILFRYTIDKSGIEIILPGNLESSLLKHDPQQKG